MKHIDNPNRQRALDLSWGTYRVTISKNGQFVRHIEYSEMSGSAMMDLVYALKRQYPKEQGYKIDW